MVDFDDYINFIGKSFRAKAEDDDYTEDILANTEVFSPSVDVRCLLPLFVASLTRGKSPETASATGRPSASASVDSEEGEGDESASRLLACPLGLRQILEFVKAQRELGQPDGGGEFADDIENSLRLVHEAGRVLRSKRSVQLFEWAELQAKFPKILKSLRIPGFAVSRSKARKAKKKNIKLLKQCIEEREDVARDVCERFRRDAAAFEFYDSMRLFARQPLTKRSLHVYRILGKGGFGSVFAASITHIGRGFALKVQSRRAVKRHKKLKMVLNEREVLRKLGTKRSPFCVYLLYAFADQKRFYLGMPLAVCGDLGYHIKHAKGKRLGKKRAAFYSAEIALGLAHMHSMNIVYRDLKPANVLLDITGRCKLSDMGLARMLGSADEEIVGRAGTPGFWSPEVYLMRAYGPECDWWSFGVCLFVMLTGRPLFHKHTRSSSFDNGSQSASNFSVSLSAAHQQLALAVKQQPAEKQQLEDPAAAAAAAAAGEAPPGGRRRRRMSLGRGGQGGSIGAEKRWKVRLPDSVDRGGAVAFPSTAADLIRQLLERRRDDRLAGHGDGFPAVAKHAYFKGADFSRHYMCAVEPPWMPEKGTIYSKRQFDMEERDGDVSGEVSKTNNRIESFRNAEALGLSFKKKPMLVPSVEASSGSPSVPLTVVGEAEQQPGTSGSGEVAAEEDYSYVNLKVHKEILGKLLDQLRDGLIDESGLKKPGQSKEGDDAISRKGSNSSSCVTM